MLERITKFRAALHQLFTSRYVLELEAEVARLRAENRGLWSACTGNRVLTPTQHRPPAGPGRAAEPGPAAGPATTKSTMKPVVRRSWPQTQASLERVDAAQAARVQAADLERQRADILAEARRVAAEAGAPLPAEIPLRAGTIEPEVQPETAEETIQ